MGTVNIGLSGSGVVNGNRTFTVSDEDVTRWIAAYRDAAQHDKDSKDGSGVAHTPVTDAQVLAYWAREMMRQTKQQTRDHETTPPTDIDIIEN